MTMDNPYAPPRAEVEDVVRTGEVAPPLWNPNAAANWSLLLSVAFGAWLHARNWDAMGEPARAAASRRWVWGSIAAMTALGLVNVFLPRAGTLLRLGGIALLVTWYVAEARPQVRYVAGRYGLKYPRKGWGMPILAALGVLALYTVAMFAVGFAMAAAGVLRGT